MLRISFNQGSEAEKSAGKEALYAALAEIDDLLEFTGGIDEIQPVSVSEWQKLNRARGRLRKFNTMPAIAADVVFQQGRICERLGESKEALGWYERGSILFPERQSDFARGAAWCATQQGHLEEALFFSQMAVDHDPDDFSLQTNLAIALLMIGRINDAYEQVVRTYRRWPQFGPARIETIIYQCRDKGLMLPPSYVEYEKILDATEPDMAAINRRVRAAIKANPTLANLAARDEDDELLIDAARVAAESHGVDSGTLMEHLHIGYSRASKLVDSMIAKRVVGWE